MQVYADVVFVINLAMDIFILWIVGRLRIKRVPPWRIAAGGLVMAALYCLLVFAAPLRIYLNLFASLFIIAAGVVIAFRPVNIQELGVLSGLGIVSAFALGGVGMALFYFTNISDLVGNMLGYSIQNFSVKLLIASTCIFYILIRLFSGWQKGLTLKRQAFYPVKISYRETDVSITALVDTGNSLRDPISQSPVIIAEFNAVKSFLPDCIKLIFYENKENDLGSWINDLTDTGFSLRMIPYASIGKENGMLLGFRPDNVEIMGVHKTINDVVIGIYNFDLSRGGKYQGLLSPELVAE